MHHKTELFMVADVSASDRSVATNLIQIRLVVPVVNLIRLAE
jgi:hypothetical protein